jgi:hypothetical protein
MLDYASNVRKSGRLLFGESMNTDKVTGSLISESIIVGN